MLTKFLLRAKYIRIPNKISNHGNYKQTKTPQKQPFFLKNKSNNG